MAADATDGMRVCVVWGAESGARAEWVGELAHLGTEGESSESSTVPIEDCDPKYLELDSDIADRRSGLGSAGPAPSVAEEGVEAAGGGGGKRVDSNNKTTTLGHALVPDARARTVLLL